MTELVAYQVAEGLATITMNNPPLNALGQGLRAAVLAAFERAEADPGVGIICLAAAGRSWPVGADIREFGSPPVPPTLPELCTRIAAAAKPVIAALHGSALGGGLELALVCALRVASAGTRLGLPEVTLGLLPGAGGTQRLPRLIGAGPALGLILSGAPVGAERAQALGLVDRLTTGDLMATVRTIAAAHLAGRAVLASANRRSMAGAADPATYLAEIEAERARVRPPHDRAAPRIIDCVEAALLLPEDEGLEAERAAFADLVSTPEARALRHAFFAERRGARSVALPAGMPAPVLATVGIAGGGPVGAGLAAALIARGLTVRLVERDEAALARALRRIEKGLEQAQAKGEIGGSDRTAGAMRLSAATDMASMAGADLIVEAVSEEMRLKEAALAAIGRASAAVVLSVTCGLDPEALARASGRPAAHGALWLCEPLSRVSLAELALPAAAGPAVTAAAQGLARLLGWRLLGARQGRGFLGPRCWTALGDIADRCLAAGAAPHEVDRAFRAFGLPFGPYETRDLFGADHLLLRHPARREGVAEEPVSRALRAWLAGAGRTGRRARAGYHDYDAPGGAAHPAAAVQAALDGLRPTRALAADEIALMLVAGLANQGAWWLAEGAARVPSDIDLVALAQGYPRWRGGPMQAADEIGPLTLRNRLRMLAAAGDGFWSPAPLWDELIKNGRRFSDLNGD
jgi:3-hydroxyacyl-CoA dehydrogenase